MSNVINLSNHVTLQYTDDVRQICKPLLTLLNIKHFMLTLYYKDNSIIRLSTCPEWTLHYFNKGYYNVVPTLNKNGAAISYSIWDLLDAKYDHFLNMLEDSKDFHISNGFTIIKMFKDYKLVCSLCTPTEKDHSNNQYLTNLNFINNFIYYFLNETQPIIEAAKKHKIYIANNLLTDQSTNEQSGCKQIVSLDKIYLKNTLLSKQETICLLNLMLGKTSKKIAKLLNISPRTIDSYIDNIKIKTDCNDRMTLIEEAYQSELVRGALEIFSQ